MSIIPQFAATGTMQSDANPIPPEGRNFAVDVAIVPAGAGVVLPQYSSPFIACLIQNSSANALLVYPILGGTIDGAMSPFSIEAGDKVQFWSQSYLDWVTFEQGSGGGGGGFTPPSFTSFSISGQATTLECGASIASGSKNFVWTTSQPSNVATNSISITDVTTSTVLADELPNSGLAAISIGAIANNSPATHTWQIAGTDTQGGGFSRTFGVSWDRRAYWGASGNVTLTGGQVAALASSALQSGSAGSYPEGVNGYKYLCFALDQVQPALVRDSLTGFNIPLADTSDNSAYSNVNANGLTYALVSVTNGFGVTTNYAVYRSKNASASSVTIQVL